MSPLKKLQGYLSCSKQADKDPQKSSTDTDKTSKSRKECKSIDAKSWSSHVHFLIKYYNDLYGYEFQFF